MNEPGTIYYTLNGVNPTKPSTRYTGPITVSSTNILKFLAADRAGNLSPIYTRVIKDTIAPKVVLTSPKNGAKGFSRTATIIIKFSENIKTSLKWSKIIVKDKYGHIVKISKTIIRKHTQNQNQYKKTIKQLVHRNHTTRCNQRQRR